LGSDILSIFQAEDGIRDRNVTGVQTCALPIFFKKRASSALPSCINDLIAIPIITGATYGSIAGSLSVSSFRVVCDSSSFTFFSDADAELLKGKIPISSVDRKSTRLNSSHVSI